MRLKLFVILIGFLLPGCLVIDPASWFDDWGDMGKDEEVLFFMENEPPLFKEGAPQQAKRYSYETDE